MSDSRPQKTLVITGVSPADPFSSLAASILANADIVSQESFRPAPEALIARIALLGPDSDHLAAVAVKLKAKFPEVLILTQEVNITSPESLGLASHQVRSQLGAWDIFIHNPGPHTPASHTAKTTIRGADEDMWWGAFERNVRSLHFIARHFFPKMKRDAVFMNVISTDMESLAHGGIALRASADEASAMAAIRVMEHLGRENAENGLKVVNAVVGPNDESKASDYLPSLLLRCVGPDATLFNGRCLDGRHCMIGRDRLEKELEDKPQLLKLGMKLLNIEDIENLRV